MAKKYKNLINGKWCEATSKKWIDSIDPSNGSLIGSVPASNKIDVDRAVSAARVALAPWQSNASPQTWRNTLSRRRTDSH